MSSQIICPHCGPRPREEFAIRGDAAVVRPPAGAGDAAWFDYVYVRSNPKGRHLEHWHHVSGCRRWLIVERDTLTHEVMSATDAGAAAGGDLP